MYYTDGKFTYNMEKCIFRHSEEWKKIFFNTLTVKVALLANSKERMKLKEVDIEGLTLDVVKEAISVFDKFLTNIKGYEKYPVNDEYDGTDVSLIQEIDYEMMLRPFKGFFDKIEVR